MISFRSPEAALRNLFRARHLDPAGFAPTFASQLPPGAIETIVRNVRSELGSLVDVERTDAGYDVVGTEMVVPIRIVLDDHGRIAGLLLGTPRPRVPDIDRALDRLRRLAEGVNALVVADGEDLVAINPDDRLGVGSAFKLGVLAAVHRCISAGKLGWESIVLLDDAARSLAPGPLYRWPARAPLTVYTLAALMISESDNTATDLLMRPLPRATLRSSLGDAAILTTRAYFALHAPENADLAEEFVAGGARARRAVVKEVTRRPPPTPEEYAAAPPLPGVDWYLSARELCALIESVADLDVARIDTGFGTTSPWTRIATKGGSSKLGMSLVSHLTAGDGTSYTVAVTANGPELDHTGFRAACVELVAALRV